MTGRYRRFVVLAGMRTGSNLLERLLSAHPELVCHGELFNPGFIGKKDRTEFLGVTLDQRENTPMRLLDAMDQDAGSRIPGFRLFDGHDSRVLDAALDDLSTAKVLLRRDPVHSFVSLLIARATDQWMLGSAAQRRTARVSFDLRAFRTFRDKRDAFERRVLARLQESGQAPFIIQYTDLKSLEILNGLARFIGADGRLEELGEPIRRQNPEPLSEKVENFEEMRVALASEGLADEELPAPPPRGPSIPALITTNSGQVLYAPIPGVPAEPITNWLRQFGGHRSDHNRASLNDWLDAHPGHHAFTLVSHPLERAWRAFITRIVPSGPDGYPRIRRRLINHHGLELPDDPAQWPVAQRATAFEAFLKFLKANVAGQTGLRIDQEWAPQGDFISGLSGAVYLSATYREGDAAAALARAVGVAEGPKIAPPPPGLEAIYSKRLENLARGAYPHDYRKFGFAPWSSGRL